MKVAGGESAGETGMVVRVEDAVAVVFLDSTKTEIRVFKRDLSESSEITSLDRCCSCSCCSLSCAQLPHFYEKSRRSGCSSATCLSRPRSPASTGAESARQTGLCFNGPC